MSGPPVGVIPTGDAYTSYNTQSHDTDDVAHANGFNSDPQTTIEARAVSADGSRVMFDTPNALVPQDTNGVRDVYEWEGSAAHLISSGTGVVPSF
jgi:hypothetical protein